MKHFETVRDAIRIGCMDCKSKAIDVFGKEKEMILICRECKAVEYISKEEWIKLFE